MPENRRHMSLTKGKVTLDGITVLDAVSFHLIFTPSVSESRSLGSSGVDTRWTNYKITGSFEEYKSTNWLRNMAKEYINSGKTPEFKIQGTCTDHDCDFFDTIKVDDTVTASGCVITGDIPLFDLDTNGDLVQNNINFNVKTVV